MGRVTRHPGPAYDEQIEFDKLEKRMTQLEAEIERIKEVHRQEDSALAGHIKRLEAENVRLRTFRTTYEVER